MDNAWKGYNATLFAYGQTGSGKSWSVIGYGANKGIVPVLCDELFKGIAKKNDGTSFEVKFSMMEIYNEIATDLSTVDASKKKRESLKIRQHPKKGFYGKDRILLSLIRLKRILSIKRLSNFTEKRKLIFSIKKIYN